MSCGLPACLLLVQDTARNFLCGSVADKKKYEIFMKVCSCVALVLTGTHNCTPLLDAMSSKDAQSPLPTQPVLVSVWWLGCCVLPVTCVYVFPYWLSSCSRPSLQRANPLQSLLLQATCLQTMYDNLTKASGLIEEMRVGFKAVKDEHE